MNCPICNARIESTGGDCGKCGWSPWAHSMPLSPSKTVKVSATGWSLEQRIAAIEQELTRRFGYVPPLILLLALLLTPALRAQEPTPAATDEQLAETEAEVEDEPSPLIGAVWCAVESGDPWLAAEQPEQVEGEEPSAPETVDACDGGVGLALWRWKRVAPVAVIGTRTIGVGVAYIAHRTAGGRAFAVAVGLVTPWDAHGGISGDARVALGATVSFGGGTP